VKKLPGTLRAAVWWWAALAVAAAGFGAASIGNAQIAPAADRTGLVALAVVLGLLGALVGYGAWQLSRGRLAGRGLLTTFGLIGGLPLLARGPRLTVLAAGLLIGVVMLWLPPSLAYFKEQSREARARRKAERAATRPPTRRP
jgi:hypothetical protein